MTLLYVLIGLAAVYAAYYFGARKGTARLHAAGIDGTQTIPEHVHENRNESPDNSHKQHSHGGCC